MEWKEYFLGIAEQVKEKSKDQSTKVGAVIVGQHNEILSTGYNSFPRGLDDNKQERQVRPEKYFWFEHAERNAIYNAARIGIPIDGSTIYLTTSLPCSDCARGIINSGIKKVFCKKRRTLNNDEKWEESEKKSLQMFIECGVEIEYY